MFPPDYDPLAAETSSSNKSKPLRKRFRPGHQRRTTNQSCFTPRQPLRGSLLPLQISTFPQQYQIPLFGSSGVFFDYPRTTHRSDTGQERLQKGTRAGIPIPRIIDTRILPACKGICTPPYWPLLGLSCPTDLSFLDSYPLSQLG